MTNCEYFEFISDGVTNFKINLTYCQKTYASVGYKSRLTGLNTIYSIAYNVIHNIVLVDKHACCI